MDWLLPLAIKSFAIAAAVLLVLQIAARRSAADRSIIAHLGLAALLLLPIGAWLLPQLEFQTALMGQSEVRPVINPPEIGASEVAPSLSFPSSEPASAAWPIDWGLLAYLVPASLLLLLTLTAVLRLGMLKGRAEVIVEAHWLRSLAQAQRRMGMKHGTALLVSRDLQSPISWGLFRPVILLSDEALGATREAEAIIAHELAHVQRLDWVKLMLARVVTALFWFNPLVWLIAREAHQLREEAADDAVLAAEVDCTDYAELLVGIARHECRGMLVGAHGVAPGRNSLKRRVRRVLDGSLARSPASRTWFAGFACGAFVAATPLAALTLVPAQPKRPVAITATPNVGTAANPAARRAAMTAPRDPAEPARVWLDPLPPQGGREVGAPPQRIALVERASTHDPGVDVDVDVDLDEDGYDRMALAAAGVTPAYASAVARAAPRLGAQGVSTLVALRSSGVTPELLQDLRRAGYGRADREQVIAAAIHNVSGTYLRAMQAQGVRASLEEMTEMRVIGVTPGFVAELRRRGAHSLTPDRLIEYRAIGLHPDELPHSR